MSSCLTNILACRGHFRAAAIAWLNVSRGVMRLHVCVGCGAVANEALFAPAFMDNYAYNSEDYYAYNSEMHIGIRA